MADKFGVSNQARLVTKSFAKQLDWDHGSLVLSSRFHSSLYILVDGIERKMCVYIENEETLFIESVELLKIR